MSVKANKNGKQQTFLVTQNTHTTNNLAIKISVKITCGRPRKKRGTRCGKCLPGLDTLGNLLSSPIAH